MLEVAIKTLPDNVVLPLIDKLPVKDVLPLTLNADALLPVKNREPDNKVEPVICVLPLCNKLPVTVAPFLKEAVCERKLPVKDPVYEPVGDATPVNPVPSPINEPLTVPLTNRLPVKAVLPVTLNARALLPVNNNEPDKRVEPVICVLPLCKKLPDKVLLH